MTTLQNDDETEEHSSSELAQADIDSTERAWHIASRWQALDAEYRANHLRIVSVVAFYAVHLLQHYRPLGIFGETSPGSSVFHLAVTLIVASWLLTALAIDFCLRNQIFPASTPFLTTGVDLALLTSVLSLGGGQQSPLIFAYGLILVLAAIRFNLVLIRATTAGALLGYLFLLALGRWPDSLSGMSIAVVPRYAQCITLLTIAMTGVMLGQLVRRVRVMAYHFAERRDQD